MLTYTISVLFAPPCSGIRSFLANTRATTATTAHGPDTINTRPRRRPSVQLETDRPGIEAMVV